MNLVLYRVEQIKGRLVDRFSEELLRVFLLFPPERGEMRDVPSLSSLLLHVCHTHTPPGVLPPLKRQNDCVISFKFGVESSTRCSSLHIMTEATGECAAFIWRGAV